MRFLLMVIAGLCAILLYLLIASSEAPSPGSVEERRAAARARGEITSIEDQVAAEAIASYRLVEMGSNSAERCERASAAVKALSRTQYTALYDSWKETERKECEGTERDSP